ncbi:MAG: lytic murein transglycosylase, partial [Deltaproteobacteria bacterium]|nr:lytic murein transglycosylase [Deltaproteobacteria bacterium]
MATFKSYGVDKEIITAIILVETRLGNFLGGPSTVNMLSTMASLYDSNVRDMFWNETLKSQKLSMKKYEKWARRKSNWAYSELKAFLKYTARENIDPVTVNGSYA